MRKKMMQVNSKNDASKKNDIGEISTLVVARKKKKFEQAPICA